MIPIFCGALWLHSPSFECHLWLLYFFSPWALFDLKPILYITRMHCILFGRVNSVWDAWSTLDCECVFFGAVVNWIEDKRHTPLVAALSFRRSLRAWRNDNQRRHSLPFSFSLYFFFFFFFTLYLSQSFSLIRSSFSFTLFLSPHRLPTLPVFAISLFSLLSFSLCLSC